MPRFTYIALDSRGQESTGLVEAASTNEAIGQLRQAGYFPTNVYEEGEGGGVLELVLTRLAEFQEKAAKIKNKVAAAMVYPLIVMTMAVTIMGFLLVFIVPKFEAIFHDMLGDRPLPVITTFVITVSRFVQGHWIVILALIFAAVAGYKFANRDRKSTRL